MRKALYEGWKEISDRLNVTERTAREWAEHEGLPVQVLCGLFRMSEEKLQAWEDSKTVLYPTHIQQRRARKARKAA